MLQQAVTVAPTATAMATVTASSTATAMLAPSPVETELETEDNAYVITLGLPADLDPGLLQQFTAEVETYRMLP